MTAPGVVFFLSSEWSRYHRPGLLRAVAAATRDRGPAIVVDNPVCLATARWHRPQRWQAWRQSGAAAPRLRPVADNLWLLDAGVVLHDKLSALLPGAPLLNRRWLGGQLRAARRHLGLEGPWVGWYQFPTQHHYAGRLGEALALYECYDEHSDVPGLSRPARQRLIGLEQRLMARCGLVFTTSRPLYEARRASHPNVALTYNGADLDFFAPVGEQSLRRVAAPRDGPLTVGYLGTIHEHTDLELMCGLAERRPDWTFSLIGPVQPGAAAGPLARLRTLPNVQLHGWVDEADLHRLLDGVDVGVIPYRQGARFNQFVNPNKLHEYTAMGKPVVASAGVDLSSHGGSVSTAAGVDEFVAAIEAEHAADDEAAVRRRLETARGNSWQARAQLMLAHIDRTLSPAAAATVPAGVGA
ncbi:glycosyltransferase [Aquabacterium sp. J223]|uniref:glycosyltransferase n=1 Tax=Aquabacterium sp. J223 TaxID=2898431 RepID=UPI0021AE02FB|nr:glycosyltransferase [Aquabacterium sp. J223]UUX94793.1 glycosyltransferase [Aquabacterium sp. J223]